MLLGIKHSITPSVHTTKQERRDKMCLRHPLLCIFRHLSYTQTGKFKDFVEKGKQRQKEQIKAWIANELLMKGQAEIWRFSAEACFLHYTPWEARSVCVFVYVCVRDTWNWNDALWVQMHEHHDSIPHNFPNFKQKPAGFHPQWQPFELTFDLLCKKRDRERIESRLCNRVPEGVSGILPSLISLIFLLHF